jgi:CheY-like chemotaxis protein
MSIIIRLLVVEDDNEQYETYSDTVEDLRNGDSGIQFELIRKTNSQDAQSALLSNDFDAAIVDLNLDSTDSTEASGNDILEKIIGSHRFPVFVVSGNLGKLNEGIREKESLFLKCYDRDKPNKEIFDEIQNICGTGITRIL